MPIIRIATRPSKLALAQASIVATKLTDLNCNITCEIVIIKTKADIKADQPINAIGGKGIFIKELEQALLAKKADIAVHSVKDMPSALSQSFIMPAILPRLAAHDVLISNNNTTFYNLAPNMIIGTSSLRRTCQLQILRPDLTYKPIRGNVDTRIKKLESGYDAIILAHAGIERLGYEQHITQNFSLEDIMPSAGQGAIGIECLSDNSAIINLVSKLNHAPSFHAITAERSAMFHLGGHCMAPIAAHAICHENNITLRAMVTNKDSSQVIRATKTAEISQAMTLGQHIAEKLIFQGALDLINTAV
jgi:hydroxymethylbilane synthase